MNIFEKIKNDAKKNIDTVISSENWHSLSGKFVNEVETKFNQIFKAKTLTINSGTSALEIALKSLGIKKGDEVIIPNFTFVATAQAVMSVGATPIICEINLETFNISTNNLQKYINSNTKAIIFVHLFGNPSGIDKVKEFCKQNSLYLIEDCAQAFGAENNNKLAGSFGDFGILSFNSTKNLTSGDGGLLIINNDNFYDKAKAIRFAGYIKRGDKYISEEIGGKNLMTEFQAAILKPQLEVWQKLRDIRINFANDIIKKIKPLNLNPQKLNKNVVSSYQRIVFTANSKKDSYKIILKHGDIINKIYDRPLVDEPIIQKYSKISKDAIKNANEFWDLHLGLTLHPLIDYTKYIKNLNFR
jgi:perosamine synthetase